MRCFADVLAINCENEARYSSIIVCITFAHYCTYFEKDAQQVNYKCIFSAKFSLEAVAQIDRAADYQKLWK